MRIERPRLFANRQSVNRQSVNRQSVNRQSPIVNRQSSIPNRQSSISELFEREIDRDCHDDGHGRAIEQRGLELPLADGVDGRLIEQGD